MSDTYIAVFLRIYKKVTRERTLMTQSASLTVDFLRLSVQP